MHNALESPMTDGHQDPNEHFLNVQYGVFRELIKMEGIKDKGKFVLENAHLFRHFATHLPDDLKDSWVDADLNDLSRSKLAKQYEVFHAQIDAFIAKLDPEIKLAFDEAIMNNDTHLATYILENTFEKSQIK